MKREAFMLVFCFFLFGFQPKSRWEKQPVFEAEKYTASYQLDLGPNACRVRVKAGKKGLRLEAFLVPPMSTFDNIESLMTVVDIDTTPAGLVTVKLENFKQVVGGHLRWQPNTTNQEDLFDSLCAHQDLQSLPRGVQTMFYGNYAIGKPAAKK